MSTVIPLHLGIANAYLVIDQRPILVDSGMPGSEGQIEAALQAQGFGWSDLALILHTHGHWDHYGSSAAVRAASGAPVMAHPLDAPNLRAGSNGPLPIRPGRKLLSLLIVPFLLRDAPPVVVDLEIEADGQRLEAFGVSGSLLHTPGHSPGSITVLLDDGQAICGDLFMGGFMGGYFLSGVPGYFYVEADPAAGDHSLARLLALAPRRLYVGHGGPVEGRAFARRFAALAR